MGRQSAADRQDLAGHRNERAITFTTIAVTVFTELAWTRADKIFPADATLPVKAGNSPETNAATQASAARTSGRGFIRASYPIRCPPPRGSG
jgi:hypothetical protein